MGSLSKQKQEEQEEQQEQQEEGQEENVKDFLLTQPLSRYLFGKEEQKEEEEEIEDIEDIEDIEEIEDIEDIEETEEIKVDEKTIPTTSTFVSYLFHTLLWNMEIKERIEEEGKEEKGDHDEERRKKKKKKNNNNNNSNNKRDIISMGKCRSESSREAAYALITFLYDSSSSSFPSSSPSSSSSFSFSSPSLSSLVEALEYLVPIHNKTSLKDLLITFPSEEEKKERTRKREEKHFPSSFLSSSPQMLQGHPVNDALNEVIYRQFYQRKK